MRPDTTTPRVVALFRERWPGGMLPKRMILRELSKYETSVAERTLENALARAVRTNELYVVKSRDGGALYCLTSYAQTNPLLIESLRRAPLRSFQWKDPELQQRALKRWQDYSARHGAHDPRPGHKCIACGFVNGRYGPCQIPGRVAEYIRTHPQVGGVQTSGSESASPAKSGSRVGKPGT